MAERASFVLHDLVEAGDVDGLVSALSNLSVAPLPLLDSHGQSPLHGAAHFGRADLCDLLVKAGFSPFEKDLYGSSAVDLARTQGHLSLAAKLEGKEGAGEGQGAVKIVDNIDIGFGFQNKNNHNHSVCGADVGSQWEALARLSELAGRSLTVSVPHAGVLDALYSQFFPVRVPVGSVGGLESLDLRDCPGAAVYFPRASFVAQVAPGAPGQVLREWEGVDIENDRAVIVAFVKTAAKEVALEVAKRLKKERERQ
jgi:hypothetical protein